MNNTIKTPTYYDGRGKLDFLSQSQTNYQEYVVTPNLSETEKQTYLIKYPYYPYLIKN